MTRTIRIAVLFSVFVFMGHLPVAGQANRTDTTIQGDRKRIDIYFDSTKTRLWNSCYVSKKAPNKRVGLERQWDKFGKLEASWFYSDKQIVRTSYFKHIGEKFIRAKENFRMNEYHGTCTYFDISTYKDCTPDTTTYRKELEQVYNAGTLINEKIWRDTQRVEMDYTNRVYKCFNRCGTSATYSFSELWPGDGGARISKDSMKAYDEHQYAVSNKACGIVREISLLEYIQGAQGNPVPNGAYNAYYDNGALAYTGKYLNGVKTGTWKAFYKSGKVKSVETWTINQATAVVSSINYNEDGTVKP